MSIITKLNNQKKILEILLNLKKNNNITLIKKKLNYLDFENQYIYQILIFLHSEKKKLGKVEELSKQYLLKFKQNYFVLNNLGNFYKRKKNFKEAIVYYKKAIKIKNNLKPCSLKIKFLIKKIEKLNKIKNNKLLNELKTLVNDLIINSYMYQLVTYPRPYFSDGFSNYHFLSSNLIKYLSKSFNNLNLLKIYSFLKKFLSTNRLSVADYDNAFYNLGICYQHIKRYKHAIKFYKLANDYEKTNRYYSKILECLYLKKDKKNFTSMGKNLNNIKKVDFNSLAICNYASDQLSIRNPYSLCERPIEKVLKLELKKKKIINQDFLYKLEKDIIFGTNKVNTPVVIGFKSMGNLFDVKLPSIEKLKKIILLNINDYKNNFKNRNSLLIKKWPKKFYINAWYIKLKKGGEVLPHIHDGWLSGVFYIKTSAKSKLSHTNSGQLEVNYKFSNLKEFKKNIFKKVIPVNDGDLLLFPSSLPHHVIPYKGIDERLSIAFDMKPLS
tara:strand:+ start:206 stop:1696 length:1491 start_codon:yes stop_codon:yes gene_type:complete